MRVDAFGDTQSAITQIATRLEHDGRVARSPDPSDGRAVLIHITPAGTELVAARHAERVSKLARLTDRLSLADRQAIAATRADSCSRAT